MQGLITYVGILLLPIAVLAAPFFIAHWLYKLYQNSDRVQERKAREKTAAILYRAGALKPDCPDPQDFAALVVQTAFLTLGDLGIPIPSVAVRLLRTAQNLYEAEEFTLAAIAAPPPLLNSVEGARYREKLLRIIAKLENPLAFETVEKLLLESFSAFVELLPSSALGPPLANSTSTPDGFVQHEAPFTALLVDLLHNPGASVYELLLSLHDRTAVDLGLFERLRDQLDRNLYAASGVAHGDLKNQHKLVMPSDSDRAPHDLVAAYLSSTPLEEIYFAPVPLYIPEPLRFEHAHILAGSGHGKTQTLQQLILADLRKPDPPSLVIIDSQGDMIRKISRLALFEGALADRLIIIDPRDVEHPPALNMFDVNIERLKRYGAADREQILNGIIELYEYFFGSLLGAELTQKQTLIFRYLARLLIQIPAATIRTLIEIMDDTRPYQHVIDALPESARMFFDKEFADRSYTDTKTQIKRRLYGIIENQTFERMFSAPKNRIDVPTALNEGKIILVNTAKDFLKGGSSILGRYFIALTLQAALERAAVPESKRRPAFLYVDEAAEYFDSNIDNLLNQARKYKLGIVMAHQYLDQLSGGLRSSIASNTSIKLSGGVSERDARALAPDMRTTPTFILQQTRGAQQTHFAAYLRNLTPRALSLAVSLGALEREPTMSDEAYTNMLRENRRRVSAPAAEHAVEARPSIDADKVDVAPSAEWG